MSTEPIRNRILRAAAEEFARHGFEGARVARIAAAAEANKERLYHYYGNKEDLFTAVLDEAMRQLAAAEPFAADDLGGYVARMVDFHREHPTLVQLLLAEARHHGSAPLPHESDRAAHYRRRVEAIRQAQRRGAVRTDVDPETLLYAVLALVATASALPQLTRLILGADPVEVAGHGELRAGLRRLLDVLTTPRP
ncbi:TetR family transcriptional regulator [Gandjariella thermophila]|uniref:HTH-type transcriptional repressor n=1 Tax=Gandjariella thermophila TaxID=1931992 RepID=A0A4D4J6F3_9PSEU|nr:TetR family transcriptional regulator [Gandjariella thermophila]GDY30308.1 HTH-type transcriptional repressor [Gandjariella thermophila]